MTIIAALTISLMIAYWFLKPRKKQKQRPLRARTEIRRDTKKPTGAYHAVSVKSGGCGCEAVNAMRGERFLTNGGRVPNLPVADCTAINCTCRYVHYDDRRSAQGDRRAAYSMQSDMYGLNGDVDRRSLRGRRASDRLQDAAADEGYGDIQWTT